MKGLLLVFSLSGTPGAPGGDPWFAADKLQHFFTSAFVQTLSYGSLRGLGASHGTALTGASVATAAVGVGKELYDARHGGDPSAKDLVWDAAGAASMGALLSRTAR